MPDISLNPQRTTQERRPRRAFRHASLGMAAVAASLAVATWAAAERTESLVPEGPQPVVPRQVAARGRIEPANGVVRLSGPAARQPAVVTDLRVAEGDWVEPGDVIAVLDGVAALQATTQSLDAVVRHATAEQRRFAPLCASGVAAAAECDLVRLRLDTARADLARARADLDASYVRAPGAGRILRTHASAGERVGAEGIVEMGDTRAIDVVAEIYETDAPRLRRGQIARVHAAILDEPLVGSVERIGVKVGKQRVFDLDPIADTDARIVEARIRLADGDSVAGLTNLQVDVVIELDGAGGGQDS